MQAIPDPSPSFQDPSVATVNLNHPSQFNEQQPAKPEEKQAPLTKPREEVLVLDVNLGRGQSARIVLYEGDKPINVIEQFAHEHNLNDKKKTKLLEVINSQLSVQVGKV